MFKSAPELWLPAEKQILEKFAIQYLYHEFEQATKKQEIVFLNEILVMYGIGGIDIRPILEEIIQINDWYSIVSIAYLLMSERKADGTLQDTGE